MNGVIGSSGAPAASQRKEDGEVHSSIIYPSWIVIAKIGFSRGHISETTPGKKFGLRFTSVVIFMTLIQFQKLLIVRLFSKVFHRTKTMTDIKLRAEISQCH